MCGIAGQIGDPAFARDATARMAEAMRARGPDAGGLWCDGGLALGHRRLAIVDLDTRANQPMHGADGRYTVVFNGEIYNHAALRAALEREGVGFRTRSDTEVLLALYARDGEAMLPKLRGMFAFAIWDAATRSLFLARDPYGIKPLYYTRDADGFAFASQVRALVAGRRTTPALEPAGLVGFHLWGSVPEPWTLYSDVLQLPAGHWLRVHADGSGGSPACWHDIREHWRQPAPEPPAGDELLAMLRAALADSVAAHLVADVPLCIFLSGGVDSALLAALLHDAGAPPLGITLAFREFAGQAADEAPGAAVVAAAYGLRHEVREVTRDEFRADLPRLLAAMDQPSVDGINTWFAAKAAAESGHKVALSGLGGDELFCGYPSFTQVVRAQRAAWLAGRIPGGTAMLRPGLRAWARWRGQPKHACIPDHMQSLEGLYFLRRGLFMPQELPSLLPPDVVQAGLERLDGALFGIAAAAARDAVAGVGALESTHYLRHQLLRDADWASMAHSVELRTPFVDARLLAALAPSTAAFRNGRGKRLQAAVPEPPLPAAIRDRRKTGFSLPMAQWLRDDDVPVPRLLAGARVPWARRWAWRVARALAPCA
jgi:asparagine synthase (glutamine-hydrolysing)